MHSSFTFSPNVHRSSSNNKQQQHPIYNIGTAPAFPHFVNHRQPNLFLNQQAFTRSFASVVSCDSHQGKHQNMSNADANVSNNNSGIFGSFLKHFNKPATPHCPPQIPLQSQHKEFEDFTHMPSVNNQCTLNHILYQHQPAHINLESPNVNSNSFGTATSSFMASFFGQRQGQIRPKKPWFNKGFRCRGGRWGKHQYNPKFHQHDVNISKNSQEKERSSIEQDIQDDSCDFVHVIEDKEVKMPTNNPNETAKGSCFFSKDSSLDDPPFMIYSLEEFPTIATTVKPETAAHKKQTSSPCKSNEGFVVVPTEASISTPSFTPKRISLCEKLIKSPTKLFPKPVLPVALKPCLKMPRRRFSECSDDFIVFADDDCEEQQDNDSCSDAESETSSDESDDDIFEDDEEASDEEEVDECDNIRCETPDRQIDSGVEERRVSFAIENSLTF